MILIDTSGLLAAIDGSQKDHASAARTLLDNEPRILSPFVLAELDYLLWTRLGQGAELALLAEVARGAYRLENFTQEDVNLSHSIISHFSDLQLDLADASIVVLAKRYDCKTILTLDERHFRSISGPDGEGFLLFPYDA